MSDENLSVEVTQTAPAKSVAKNYIYNMIYQVFLVIVPLLTTPYIARAIGVDGSGYFSYASSIVSYFTLFAALGFGYYAQRLIASHSGDKHQQTIDFWEIFVARLIPTAIALAVYFVLFAFNIYNDTYKLLMLILSINVLAVAFDVSYLLQGNEEFGKLVLRNIFIKVLSIACIFIFVKRPEHLWIYTLINAGSTFVSNLALWAYLPKMLTRVSIKEIKCMKHLPATLLLFIPTIAVSIYTTLDKTLIGAITQTASENGNYEYAERIVRLTLTVVTALGLVLVPRNTKFFAEGKRDDAISNIYLGIRFVFLLGMPIMLGLIAVADNFSPWFFSEEYTKVALLIKLLSPIVVIIGLSNVLGLQFLIPSGQDKKFTLAIIAGAITNFVLNCILIYFFKSEGAAIATIIAEGCVTAVMYTFVRKDLKIRKILNEAWKYIVASIIMFIPCYILNRILNPSILNTIIIVAVGVAVYAPLLLLLKDDFVLSILKRIFRHKRAQEDEGNKMPLSK